MAVSLLATKIHVPRPRPNAVPRPRLTEKLLDALEHPGTFILLSGPAGFGKSTLLNEFVSKLPCPAAWVSLDEADNDPISFWTYLITACQSIQPEIGISALALLQIPQPLPAETIPTLLINDLVRLGKEAVLVLDDYHAIQNPSIHAALVFFLEHLPDNFHPAISTRVDPPWPLSRLRARDRLIELRAADLRFTTEEAAIFLNQVVGLNLEAEEIAALEARTEGWIASLQLAAISMKGRSDVTGFIKSFTGSHVYVAEYLVDEVLACQPGEVQSFLLRTSILDRLTSKLCEAVSGLPEAQVRLKDLYQANLFLLPLDDQGQWFRYHQLFADLLRARLGQTVPAEEVAALHRRAAIWFEQAGMMSEAMTHTLAAGDYSPAVQLIEAIAVPMILKAYFKTLEDWLQAIPPEYLARSAPANIAFARMYLMRRDSARAARHLEYLQELFSTQPEMEPVLRAQWLTLQSMALNARGKPAESRALAEQALRLLPETESELRSMTYMELANASEQMLEYEQATEACEAIIALGRAAGDVSSEVFGLSYLGRMLLQMGRLHSIYEIVTQALGRMESTGAFSPFSATLYGEIAQVYYYWHQLAEARDYFSRSVEWSKLGGFSDAEIYYSVFLSRLFQMEGDLQASVREIEKALDLVRTAAPAVVREEVVAQQVSIFLALDRSAAVETTLNSYGFTFGDGFSYPELSSGSTPHVAVPHPVGLLYNSALRTLLHRSTGRQKAQALKQGIELADLVLDGLLRSKHLPMALQSLLLRAQLSHARGEEEASLGDVIKALELAAPEGFISPFVEEGQWVAEPLRRLMKRDLPGTIDQEYVQRILAAFPSASREGAEPGAAQSSGGDSEMAAADEFPPVEPLTRRELEVLQLIARGDSNQVVAEKLVITLSAVKKHTSNIFHKLNVNSRTQAIVHARRLGLIS